MDADGDWARPNVDSAPLRAVPYMADALVLVIDDNPANVTLLEKVLIRAGVGHVVGLTDARLALSAYQEHQPDLVLLDLHMPHLDGLAVLRQFATCTPVGAFVPVLVLTADVTEGAKRAALASGAKDFLTKPFDQAEVVLRAQPA